MIRKNPSGDLPVVHESAFVDPTAILCGKVVVEENVFIGSFSISRGKGRGRKLLPLQGGGWEGDGEIDRHE